MGEQKVSKEDQRLSKKAAIFDAAMDIFMEKGYEETRIIDIARKAGIGKGTVYEYFSSKEELFFEMLCGRMSDHMQEIVRIRESQEGPEAKLKAYLDLEFDHMRNCRPDRDEGKKISLDVIFGKNITKNEKISIQIRTMMEDRLEFLMDIIKEGIEQHVFRKQNIYLAAVLILGAISFEIAQCHDLFPGGRFSGLQSDAEAAREVLYQFILRGLSG